MCEKKLYPTQREASEHKAWIKLKASDRIPKRAYYCHVCRGWHLTSAKRSLGFATYRRIDSSNYHTNN